MYEDDRQTALAMYGRMFDETADEAGLMDLLVSPTRQAVVLARSYDAKARKLQIESESGDDTEAPAFIYVIDKTAQQAAELGTKEALVTEGQFSIFDEAFELPETLLTKLISRLKQNLALTLQELKATKAKTGFCLTTKL